MSYNFIYSNFLLFLFLFNCIFSSNYTTLKGTSLHEIGISMQGSNGLLSNLDLINLMTKSRSKVRRNQCRVVATTRLELRTNTTRRNPWTEQFQQFIESSLPKYFLRQLHTTHRSQPRWIDTIIGITCSFYSSFLEFLFFYL